MNLKTLSVTQQQTLTQLIQGYPITAVSPTAARALQRKKLVHKDGRLTQWAYNTWVALNPGIEPNSVDPGLALLNDLSDNQLREVAKIATESDEFLMGNVLQGLINKKVIVKIARNTYALTEPVTAAWDDWAVDNQTRLELIDAPTVKTVAPVDGFGFKHLTRENQRLYGMLPGDGMCRQVLAFGQWKDQTIAGFNSVAGRYMKIQLNIVEVIAA